MSDSKHAPGCSHLTIRRKKHMKIKNASKWDKKEIRTKLSCLRMSLSDGFFVGVVLRGGVCPPARGDLGVVGTEPRGVASLVLLLLALTGRIRGVYSSSNSGDRRLCCRYIRSSPKRGLRMLGIPGSECVCACV